MNIINVAKTAITTGDPALTDWARRNLECEMESMGDALRKFRRRASSRFPAARQEAVEWESTYRTNYLAAMSAMAMMIDEIDELEK
jgi:hypothetical protein